MAAVNESIVLAVSVRRLATALQAAIASVLSAPGAKAVHQLRTTTRRIEAQLALLEFLQQLPSGHDDLRRTRKALRRIRRKAGEVRDLDVHVDLLETYRTGAPAQSGTRKHEAKRVLQLREDVESLLDVLQRRRKKRADRLQRALTPPNQALQASLHQLVAELSADENSALSRARFETGIHAWFDQQESRHRIPERSDADLHATRKAAKMARYLAEESRGSAALARRFEALQDSGGHWHDLLTLAETAKVDLRKKRPLPAVLRRDARGARKAFREHLQNFRAPVVRGAAQASPTRGSADKAARGRKKLP